MSPKPPPWSRAVSESRRVAVMSSMSSGTSPTAMTRLRSASSIAHSTSTARGTRNHEQARQGKPEKRETRAIERAGFHARKIGLHPQERTLAGDQRRQRQRKAHCRAGIARLRRRQFMQRAESEPAAKRSIERLAAQAQRGFALRRDAGIDLRHRTAQTVQRIRCLRRKAWVTRLFMFCSIDSARRGRCQA